MARVLGYAVAGAFAGAVLAVVAIGLLGGLATIPQVDWRHSDALADVVGNTIVIGLIFGTILGVPIGSVIGLVTGVILGLRPPATRGTAARPLDTGPSGKADKPTRPFDKDFGATWVLIDEAPARPRKKWPAFLAGLGLVILALSVALNLLWYNQRRYERQETNLRLRQLATGDPNGRRDALEAIRGLGPYAALPVVDAMEDKDLGMRRAALLASHEVLESCLGPLGVMNCMTGFVPGRGAAASGFEQLTAALRRALGDEDRALRLDAVRVLSRIADHQWEGMTPPTKLAGAVLKEHLEKEGDPAARKDLIQLLGTFHPSSHHEGASALARATRDPDEAVRQAALQTLRESLSGLGGIPAEKDACDELRAVAPLLLREAKKRKDVSALTQLGSLGEPEAVIALVEAIHDPLPGLRSSAAAALGRLGYLTFHAEVPVNDRIREELRKSIHALIAALRDSVPDVRRHAAVALGSMGAAALQAIPALEEAAATEQDQYIRHWIVEASQCINRAADIDTARRKGPSTVPSAAKARSSG